MSATEKTAALFPWLPPDQQNNGGRYLLVGHDRDVGSRLMEDSQSYAFCLASLHLRLAELVAEGHVVEEERPGFRYSMWWAEDDRAGLYGDDPACDFEIIRESDVDRDPELRSMIKSLRQDRKREDRERRRMSRRRRNP